MTKTTRELTKVFLDRCPRDPARSTTYYDSLAGGLQFVPSRTKSGSGSFYFRYTSGGKRRKLRLGSWPSFNLQQARRAARKARESVACGIDPAAERDARRAEATGPSLPETYGAVVEEFVRKYHRTEQQNVRWQEPRRILLREGKRWLKRPVTSITKREIYDLLDQIMERGAPYMANRTYASLRTFFVWCVRRDIIEVDAMAGLTKPFANEQPRQRVYNDAEIKSIWQAADKLGLAHGSLLKCALLLGKRKTALSNMRRDEINGCVWTPASKGVKRKRLHVTVLPALAQRIIAGLPEKPRNPFVFAGHRHGLPVNPSADMINEVRRLSRVEDFTMHALRHTVETRLAVLRVPPHVRDLMLDHTPRRGAGAGYDHHDYAEEMREASEAWAREVERIIGGEGVARLR